jgi:hypothetical protein
MLNILNNLFVEVNLENMIWLPSCCLLKEHLSFWLSKVRFELKSENSKVQKVLL